MRHDVRVPDELLSSMRGRAHPSAEIPVAAQPFTHLGAPNTEVDADERLTEALDKLVTVGDPSMSATPSTGSRICQLRHRHRLVVSLA